MTVMLSRPPASLAASMSCPPASSSDPAPREDLADVRPRLTIDVRPSLHSRKTSPSRAGQVRGVDVDLGPRGRARG